MDHEGDLTDIRKIEIASGKLYGYAQEKRLSSVFPTGLLSRIDCEQVLSKVFFEIMGKDTTDDFIQTLP